MKINMTAIDSRGGIFEKNNVHDEARQAGLQPKGFTLIELMIVVVILSVLAMISLPTYSAYIKKSKRTAAKVALMSIAQAQEKYYAEKLTYAKNLSDLSIGYDTSGGEVTTKENEYELKLAGFADLAGAACNPDSGTACLSYIATASITSDGPQKQDVSCSEFSINNVGEQSAKSDSGDEADYCWGAGNK